MDSRKWCILMSKELIYKRCWRVAYLPRCRFDNASKGLKTHSIGMCSLQLRHITYGVGFFFKLVDNAFNLHVGYLPFIFFRECNMNAGVQSQQTIAIGTKSLLVVNCVEKPTALSEVKQVTIKACTHLRGLPHSQIEHIEINYDTHTNAIISTLYHKKPHF